MKTTKQDPKKITQKVAEVVGKALGEVVLTLCRRIMVLQRQEPGVWHAVEFLRQ